MNSCAKALEIISEQKVKMLEESGLMIVERAEYELLEEIARLQGLKIKELHANIKQVAREIADELRKQDQAESLRKMMKG